MGESRVRFSSLFEVWAGFPCPAAGQSQRSRLVLVASRCSSVGEPRPAHHPRHDLTQRPPHRHPQSAHLCHAQTAAVIVPRLRGYVTGEQNWRELLGFLRTSDICLSEWFIDSFWRHSITLISFFLSVPAFSRHNCLHFSFFFGQRVFIFSSVHPLFQQSPPLTPQAASQMKLQHLVGQMTYELKFCCFLGGVVNATGPSCDTSFNLFICLVALSEPERASSYKLSCKVDKERLHTHAHTHNSQIPKLMNMKQKHSNCKSECINLWMCDFPPLDYIENPWLAAPSHSYAATRAERSQILSAESKNCVCHPCTRAGLIPAQEQLVPSELWYLARIMIWKTIQETLRTNATPQNRILL